MAGGRPTKYNEEMVQQAKDYIINYAEHEHIIPSIVGMSLVLKVNKSTLYEWASDPDKEFSAILDECMATQEIKLFNGGLTGSFNSAIAKLALGKHGYSDRQDVEVIDKTPPSPGKRKGRIAELLGRC